MKRSRSIAYSRYSIELTIRIITLPKSLKARGYHALQSTSRRSVRSLGLKIASLLRENNVEPMRLSLLENLKRDYKVITATFLVGFKGKVTPSLKKQILEIVSKWGKKLSRTSNNGLP